MRDDSLSLTGADFASGLRSAAQGLLDSGDLEGGTILGQPAASAVSSIVAALGTETGTAALPDETSVLFGLVGEGVRPLLPALLFSFLRQRFPLHVVPS